MSKTPAKRHGLPPTPRTYGPHGCWRCCQVAGGAGPPLASVCPQRPHRAGPCAVASAVQLQIGDSGTRRVTPHGAQEGPRVHTGGPGASPWEWRGQEARVFQPRGPRCAHSAEWSQAEPGGSAVGDGSDGGCSSLHLGEPRAMPCVGDESNPFPHLLTKQDSPLKA